jgi:hypothetical protein
VPAQIAAVADVRDEEAGAASALITAAYQVGGALGVAAITTLANGKVSDALAAGRPPFDALIAGFHHGLVLATAFAAANIVLAVISPALRPSVEQVAEGAVLA